MIESAISELTLRRWLLGQLPEHRREALEDLLFRSDLAWRLEAAEADLLDDYARGKLTPSERRAVEERLLATPEDHHRLRVATALARSDSDQQRARSQPSALLVAGFALLAIAAPFLVRLSLDSTPAIPTISILDAQVRAGGALKVPLPAGTPRVRLQFEVAEPGPARSLNLFIYDSAGGVLARFPDLPLQQAGAFKYIEAKLPIDRLLSPGDKTVVIRTASDAPPLARWRLRFESG